MESCTTSLFRVIFFNFCEIETELKKDEYTILTDPPKHIFYCSKCNKEYVLDSFYPVAIYRNILEQEEIKHDLIKFSSNYQAEINRRYEINPNDPSIEILKQLRKEKINYLDTKE